MADLITVSDDAVSWEPPSAQPSYARAPGTTRLYTRDASIRIKRRVESVWAAWTSREFWKCLFSYESFEGEFCPASEFFAKGLQNGKTFLEHGEFSVVQDALAIRYHVWHWGCKPEDDFDSSVTVTFRDGGDGSTKILVIQTWRVLESDASPSFDWNERLENIRLFLENICS